MRVNGTAVPFEPITLLDFLVQEGYQPEHVVVERSQEIITREQFGKVLLRQEDELNILQFMGGG